MAATQGRVRAVPCSRARSSERKPPRPCSGGFGCGKVSEACGRAVDGLGETGVETVGRRDRVPAVCVGDEQQRRTPAGRRHRLGHQRVEHVAGRAPCGHPYRGGAELGGLALGTAHRGGLVEDRGREFVAVDLHHGARPRHLQLLATRLEDGVGVEPRVPLALLVLQGEQRGALVLREVQATGSRGRTAPRRRNRRSGRRRG